MTFTMPLCLLTALTLSLKYKDIFSIHSSLDPLSPLLGLLALCKPLSDSAHVGSGSLSAFTDPRSSRVSILLADD